MVLGQMRLNEELWCLMVCGPPSPLSQQHSPSYLLKYITRLLPGLDSCFDLPGYCFREALSHSCSITYVRVTGSSICHALIRSRNPHNVSGNSINMAGYVNATWEVPPPAVLNVSDCDAIAPWIAHVLNAFAERGTLFVGVSDTLGMQTDFPISVAVKFLRSLVPDNWTTPTDGDLLLWHLDLWGSNGYFKADNYNIFLYIFDYVYFECGSTICPNLNFSGDSDLSGIGVSLLVSCSSPRTTS